MQLRAVTFGTTTQRPQKETNTDTDVAHEGLRVFGTSGVAQILRNLEQQGQLTPGEEPMNEDLVRKKGSAAIIDAGQVALQKILMALSELGKPDGVS